MWKYAIPFLIATPMQAQTLTEQAQNYCKWEGIIAWYVTMQYQEGATLSETLHNLADKNADNVIPRMYEDAKSWPRRDTTPDQDKVMEAFKEVVEMDCVEVMKTNPYMVE